ncbi:MAG: hypothetical protein ACRC6T_07535 [Sarcina sp.]
MGANKLALKFLVRDKKSMFYLIASMVVGYTALFTLFNIYYSGTMQTDTDGALEAGIIILAVIFLIGYMGWFINETSLATRRKEMAIQLLGGISRPRAMRLAWMQSVVLSIIAIIIAFFTSAAITPIICMLVFNVVGLDYIGVKVSMEGAFISVAVILIQLVAVFLNNGGLCYRNEIVGIIKMADKDEVPKIEPKKSLAILSVIACILPIGGLVMKLVGATEIDYTIFMDFANYVTIFGLAGLGTYGIPYFIDEIIRKYFKHHKEHTITLKNLKYIVIKSIPLYIGYVLIRVLSIMVIGSTHNAKVFAIGTISLNMITIIITVALIYRVVFTALKRRSDFKVMLCLGYKKDAITRIIKNEMGLYLFTVVVIPLLHLLLSIIVYGNFASYLIFITSYLVISILGIIVSYFIYKKIVFEYIDENQEREVIR